MQSKVWMKNKLLEETPEIEIAKRKSSLFTMLSLREEAKIIKHQEEKLEEVVEKNESTKGLGVVNMFFIIEFNIIRLLVYYMLITLFFVNHDMLLKDASLIKHLATYLAYIWFITSMLSLSSIYAVSLNIPLLIKQNSYYLTKRKIAKFT